MMQMAGYGPRVRRNILETGVKGYEKKVLVEELWIRAINQPKEVGEQRRRTIKCHCELV